VLLGRVRNRQLKREAPASLRALERVTEASTEASKVEQS